MTLEELKKLRKENFLAHKKKKKAYYLKSKIAKKEIDYEAELNNLNFFSKIKEIAHEQKKYIDDRKESIISKLKEYKNLKKEYYEQNKEKILEYNKEYRERKKEELKAYRIEYYKRLKEKQNKLDKE
ncbi:hypothetical protein [Arcobacter defluvii]|jgi:hypothetical protein|uniref:Uncharacterized protein n=1 Tax=Arcobacter defluvii TaxID=873191 RepID=A0AAE7BIA6_9BACT|nr:hypothetical protein [Arcobacter defluvii]QKF78496.1 hypothetical protein ADFLV_2513 [Arcobacter defluvii]RXI31308.1 hypothetical protein CP964_10220 [Arcobacter defluvii]